MVGININNDSTGPWTIVVTGSQDYYAANDPNQNDCTYSMSLNLDGAQIGFNFFPAPVTGFYFTGGEGGSEQPLYGFSGAILSTATQITPGNHTIEVRGWPGINKVITVTIARK